jgi:hypothetical protein
MRRTAYVFIIVVVLVSAISGFVGHLIGAGVLHPARLGPQRAEEIAGMLQRTGATKEDFSVLASDGVELRGWKVHRRRRTVTGCCCFTEFRIIAQAPWATPNFCCAMGTA